MRSRLLFLLLVVLLPTSLALPGSTRAALEFRSSGKSAVAYYSQDTGCVFTAAYVVATDNKGKDQGDPANAVSIAFTSIYSVDYCAGQLLFSVWGESDLPANAFKASSNLSQASLSPTTIAGYDQLTGDEVAIDVAMNWIGTGGLSMSNGTYHYRDEFIVVNGDGATRYRPASAAGSIVFGGVDYAAVLPPSFAELDSGRFQTVFNDKS